MKILIIAIFSLFFLPASAQQLPPFKGSLAELSAQAASSGKPYCVEVRTDWCTICRMFEEETLADSNVKDFFSRTFTFAQVDAEQEGEEFKKQYKIKSYPVILFFAPNGELIGRVNGYQDPEYFQFNAENFYRKFCKKYNIPEDKQ